MIKVFLAAAAQNDCTSQNAVLSRVCGTLQRKSTPILHQVIGGKIIIRECDLNAGKIEKC